MPNTDESYVQVATDGTGKQVRNLLIVERTTALSGDQYVETLNNRYMQVVAISDEQGHTLNLDANLTDLAAVMRDVRTELRILNFLLSHNLTSSDNTDIVSLRGDPFFTSD